MNAFTLLLLAFPLYLATKGKLIPGYSSLATSAPVAAAAPPQT